MESLSAGRPIQEFLDFNAAEYDSLHPGDGETSTTDSIVQTTFALHQEMIPGVTLHATGFGEVTTQLLFTQPEVVLDLLLFVQSCTVV